MNRTINLKGREISYELARKKVKNVNLRIRRDCSVYVSASNRVSTEFIEKFLHLKADFILAALDKYAEIAKHTDVMRDYVTGENFRYLGKDLRLVVAQGKNSASSDGARLLLSAVDIENRTLKSRLIDKWYDEQCRRIFAELVDEIYQIFQKYGVAMPELRLRKMKSRWGSCHPKRGIITLNKRLIEAPKSAIRYVVIHEFVHFLHPNHSKDFYAMQAAILPDWKVQKKLLENVQKPL